jgi:hypothetical protein
VSLVYGNFAEAKLNTGDGSHVENYDNIITCLRTILDAFFGVWDYFLNDAYAEYVYSLTIVNMTNVFFSNVVLCNYFIALLATVYEAGTE